MTNRLAAVCLAAISLVVAPITWAQSDELVTITIDESQPLSDALQSFADQTDLQVIFFADITEGKDAPVLEGEFTADAALDTLLADTGLSYTFIDDTAVSVQATVTPERGASDSKNLTPQPVLMAQNQTSQATTTSSRNSEGDSGIVTGKVTDARTGANLKGAKVTIEETGQWTSTSDLGEFRFVNVPMGSATLTVSYLGYAGQASVVDVRGDGAAQNFALRGGSEIEEIVVFGQRSARAQALNQERTASNSSTVISSDLLGQFDGTTISDALRRAPGVAFIQDELTGDGANIIVRGLEPDLNQVTLNGVRLADGSGIARSPNLSGILTESVSEITINKTLLPNQDSAGSGGLIEIETQSPFDRATRFARFGAEYGFRDNDFNSDILMSGTLSGVFGRDQEWGFGLSAQFRDREVEQYSYSVGLAAGPEFLPLDASGAPILDPRNIIPTATFPFDPGMTTIYPSTVRNSFESAQSEQLSLSASAAWRGLENTTVFLDATYSDLERDEYSRESSVSAIAQWELLPIEALDGEVRAQYVSEDIFAGFGFPGVLPNYEQRYGIVRDRNEIAQTLSLRTETAYRQWDIDSRIGYAFASSDSPYIGNVSSGPGFFNQIVNALDPAFLLPEALQNVTSDGRLVSIFAPRTGRGYPQPLFNAQGFEYYANPEFNFLSAGAIRAGAGGENERLSAGFDVRRNFETGFIKYIEGGLSFERSDSSNKPLDLDGSIAFTGSGVSFDDLGLGLTLPPLGGVGLDTGFFVVAESDIDEFLNDINNTISNVPGVNEGFLFTPDSRLQDTFTQEESFAAYLQAQVIIGKLEVVGGIRYDDTQVSARNLINPTLFDINDQFVPDFTERNNGLVDQSGSVSVWLPRVAATYRFDDNLLVRAGYSVSVARPRVQQLSDTQQVEVRLAPVGGPNNNQPTIFVTTGNPDLEPAITRSFEIGVERYFESVGQAEVNVFYKEIDNFLEANRIRGVEGVDLANLAIPEDDLIDANLDFFVTVTQPVNAPSAAKTWGIEVVFERQFDFLPGPWSDFGVYANYVYTDSELEVPFEFFNQSTGEFEVLRLAVPFSSDPGQSGTMALTWERGGINASLAYTAQDRRQDGVRPRLSAYREADDSLDFRGQMALDNSFLGDIRIFVEASDLLKGANDPDIETAIGGDGSEPTYYTGGRFFGGRTFRLGVSSTF